MDLTLLTQQNPWWSNVNSIYSDVKVKKALEAFPQYKYEFRDENLFLVGSRQVGKTTFLKLAIMDLLINMKVNPKNVLFLTCDLINKREDILEALRIFEERSDSKSKRYIMLDEISFVRDWNVLVLGLFNSGYLDDKRIYLTGSSSISLLKETFPGRDIRKVTFIPLQFREYFDYLYNPFLGSENWKNIENELNLPILNLHDTSTFYKKSLELIPFIEGLNSALIGYLYTGGLIASSLMYRSDNIDPLERLFETYRDASISDIAKLNKSQQFFKEINGALVSSYSTRISANSIARTTSVGSNKTVEAYLELMEQLFLIKRIYMNRDGKVVYRSNKKFYFTDPFIYRVLKLYSTGSSNLSEVEESKIVEGIVGIHISNRGENVEYLRTKGGKEVDFKFGDTCVEVKWGKGDLSDLKCEKGYLLTKNSPPRRDGDRISVPTSVFLYLCSERNPLR